MLDEICSFQMWSKDCLLLWSLSISRIPYHIRIVIQFNTLTQIRPTAISPYPKLHNQSEFFITRYPNTTYQTVHTCFTGSLLFLSFINQCFTGSLLFLSFINQCFTGGLLFLSFNNQCFTDGLIFWSFTCIYK